MAYLFGDSTRFPLEENFIDTLCDLIDAAVELSKADERIEHAGIREATARQRAQRETKNLEKLAGSILQTVQPFLGEAELGAGPVAARILNSARDVLEEARAEAGVRRDQMLRDVQAEKERHKEAIGKALEKFLLRHELPDTKWRFRWRSVGGTTAQAQLRTPFGLEAVVELWTPPGHPLAGPARVGDLAKGTVLRVPAEDSVFRRGGPRRRRLDGYVVTDIEHSEDRQAFKIAKSAKGASEGYELVMVDEDLTGLTVHRLADNGRRTGQALVIEGGEATLVRRLWAVLEHKLKSLAEHRTRLLRAVLEGENVNDLENPAVLVERLVGSVAPLVRQMRRKSAASGEIVLKRDLGHGRREEIYVPRERLLARIRELTPERQGLFSPLKLEEERVEESVVTMERVRPAAVPRTVPPPPPHPRPETSAAHPQVDDEADTNVADESGKVRAASMN